MNEQEKAHQAMADADSRALGLMLGTLLDTFGITEYIFTGRFPCGCTHIQFKGSDQKTMLEMMDAAEPVVMEGTVPEGAKHAH
jgi:hypothetical protein